MTATRFLSPNEKPIQVLSKWGEYANDVQFVLKKFSDSLNSNQLLTEPLQNKSSPKNCPNRQHAASHMQEKVSRACTDPHPSPGKEKANVANGLMTVMDAQQPLTRPKHPPSYDSVAKNAFHHSSAALHSSPKKRTSQETVAKHTAAGLEDVQQRPTTKCSGKRTNTYYEWMSEGVGNPRSVVCSQQGLLPSDSSDSDHSLDPVNRTSCWQADLQEIRIKDEYDRKKLEKDNLLLKASGLEAEIAVCRQKIQLLSDQIRGKASLILFGSFVTDTHANALCVSTEEEHLMGRAELEKQQQQQQEATGRESIERLKEQIVECEKDLQRQVNPHSYFLLNMTAGLSLLPLSFVTEPRIS